MEKRNSDVYSEEVFTFKHYHSSIGLLGGGDFLGHQYQTGNATGLRGLKSQQVSLESCAEDGEWFRCPATGRDFVPPLRRQKGRKYEFLNNVALIEMSIQPLQWLKMQMLLTVCVFRKHKDLFIKLCQSQEKYAWYHLNIKLTVAVSHTPTPGQEGIEMFDLLISQEQRLCREVWCRHTFPQLSHYQRISCKSIINIFYPVP